MNREEIEKKCKELLDTEETILRYHNMQRRSLPNLEAAKTRVSEAKKLRMIGIIMLAVVAALFLFVRPMLADYKAAMEAQHGFALSPSVFQFLLWAAILLIGVWGVVFALTTPDAKDVNAPKTMKENQKYNEDLDSGEAALMADWRNQAEELNRLAGTEFGAENPKYFFQVPFDVKQDFRSLRSGMEYYSDSFGQYGLGNSLVAGPLLVHDPGMPGLLQNHLRMSGFYTSKICKQKEALSVLENSSYVTIYKDQDYLNAHKNENCRLLCIYDTLFMPVENRGFFKLKAMKLEELTKALSHTWSEAQKYMASGIGVYDPYLSCRKSEVKDTRDESTEKYVNTLKYDDIYEINRGEGGEFSLYNAATCHFIEKGFCVMDKDFKKVLYIALTDTYVHISKIAFNLTKYDEDSWGDYHGWVCGAGVEDKMCKPDKASTMDFLAKHLNQEFAYFDPLMERPAGLTAEQYRYWIVSWYRGYQRQHTNA